MDQKRWTEGPAKCDKRKDVTVCEEIFNKEKKSDKKDVKHKNQSKRKDDVVQVEDHPDNALKKKKTTNLMVATLGCIALPTVH